ncbi:hypothetical protein LSAT2_031019 [Lamellibrachia satsuma]|nr:hypothetical protein LSAT2_031019 [Lamellibrachia satsuma]
MDDSEHCSSRLVRNDNMAEGDMYEVMSDSWDGRSRWAQRPAECWTSFNFGDRYISVTIHEWRCRDDFRKPFLTVYDDCDGRRRNVLARINCTASLPLTIHSSGACLSLYHYRGHTKWGYFFSLQVTALKEIIAFPAGGIAALIVASLIFIMIIVKVVCLVTGYDRRLPPLNLDPEEEKEILESAAAVDSVIHVEHADENTGAATSERVSQTLIVPMPSEHAVLRVTRSAGSVSFQSGTSSDIEYDLFDIPVKDSSPPRLKRYPSAKASSIWGHQ